jgi:uncharacterized membrane protein
LVQDRTRKIVITGVLSAISIFLGITRLGFIPWFAGASLTIMHVPVIIGAILEGPVVGVVIGLIFGVFSLIQAAVAPTGPQDVIFTNPLISILPRLFIGPISWLIYRSLKRWQIPALIAAGIGGSLTNTVLVLGMIGLLALAPWETLLAIFVGNSLVEAAASAILVVAVISVWKQIEKGGKKQGSDL